MVDCNRSISIIWFERVILIEKREQGIGMGLDTFGVVEHRLIELAGISNVFRCNLYPLTGHCLQKLFLKRGKATFSHILD